MPEIAEDLIGDVPFAVPFHGVAVGIGGQRRHVLLDGIAFGRFELVHLGPEFEDGVDRAFHRAGHVAGHIGHRHEVLVIDALVLDGLRRPSPARCSATRRPARPATFRFCMRSRSERLARSRRTISGTSSFAESTCSKSGRISGGRHLHGARDIVFGDAVQRGLLLVHQQRGTSAGRPPRTNPHPPRRRCASRDRESAARCAMRPSCAGP